MRFTKWVLDKAAGINIITSLIIHFPFLLTFPFSVLHVSWGGCPTKFSLLFMCAPVAFILISLHSQLKNQLFSAMCFFF